VTGGIFNKVLSPEENAALNFHNANRHQRNTAKKCWCCCPLCKAGNPFIGEAQAAALRDIERRIRESMLNVRPPDKRRNRLNVDDGW
jgi:hypothetical protein